MSMSFEKIKIMEKHALVISPLMALYNEKYMPITPAIECKNHPLHNTYIDTTNKITTISTTLLQMLQEGVL